MTRHSDTPAPVALAAQPAGLLVYRILGIVVPLVVVIVLAARWPLSFDGAMNMQVAQSLAEDGEYSRAYRGETFPGEIQTSSYFLVIAAAAIKLFGATTLSFQASNLVFVALLLTAVSFVLPRSRLAVLLVPGAVFFATPGLLSYSLGGYGEGAVAALSLCAIGLLAHAATTEG